MIEKEPHRCDDRCICPEHGKQLLYWPAGNEHACPDPECRFAHGYETEVARELFGTTPADVIRAQAQAIEALGAMADAFQRASADGFPALKRFGEAIAAALPREVER